MNSITLACALSAVSLCAVPALHAADAAASAPATQPAEVTLKWQATDISGKPVVVPNALKTVLVAFVMADQPQSKLALENIQAAVKGVDLDAIVVFSGDLSPLFCHQNPQFPRSGPPSGGKLQLEEHRVVAQGHA